MLNHPPAYRAIVTVLAITLNLAVAGCPAATTEPLSIERLLPAGATKAEIPATYGENHSEPQGEYAWAQGFKASGDLEKLLVELEAKLKPHGFALEDHSHYRGTFGDTGVSNAKVLRIFRGPGKSVGVYDFSVLPNIGEEYANYAITMRMR